VEPGAEAIAMMAEQLCSERQMGKREARPAFGTMVFNHRSACHAEWNFLLKKRVRGHRLRTLFFNKKFHSEP